MDAPLITVIIPVRNRPELIIRTLRSVEQQSLRPLRLIVIDNNSTDNTLAVVNKWADSNRTTDFSITVLSEPRPGASYARNAALPIVDTPYVAFFDSDDVMLPSHLEKVVAELQSNPATDLALFDVKLIDSDGWSQTKHSDDPVLLRAHIFHGILGTQRFVASAGLIKKAGPWREDCPRWNDLEFGVRLLLADPVVKRIYGSPKVYIFHTNESITGNKYFDENLSCERALSAISNLLAANGRTVELDWIDARRAILAAFYSREGHHDDATRLMRSILSQASLSKALKLRAIYTTIRLFGRGGSLLGRLLFPIQGTVTEK